MKNIRFFTAGESHGQALSAIIEGMPAGLEISEKDITTELRRRQRGYGRGGRMKIEQDRAQILSGVRFGKTLGSPISLVLYNKDWPNWTEKMSVSAGANFSEKLHMPRPGHADYAGMIKYRQDDLRNILERSSARETAMRVAAGAIAKKFLNQFGIDIFGHVIRIGIASSETFLDTRITPKSKEWNDFFERAENSPVGCADELAAKEMMQHIDTAQQEGYSLGGLFEVAATGVPVGLGSHVHWDRKLDAQIAGAMMSINAIKSVEIGLGKAVSERPGYEVHDEIFYDEKNGFQRNHNFAGGIEGGMSNGEPVVVRLAMKPLPTMRSPLRSVNVKTLEPQNAHFERADVCAVPAAVVVAESMLALVLADALVSKIGGDSINEMQQSFQRLSRVPLDW